MRSKANIETGGGNRLGALERIEERPYGMRREGTQACFCFCLYFCFCSSRC